MTIAYYDFRLTDLTDPIIAASIDPANTVTLLTPANITVANGAVSVDLVGYLWGVNQNMVLDLVTAVPEPGSLSLLVTAVAGFGLIRRRNRA